MVGRHGEKQRGVEVALRFDQVHQVVPPTRLGDAFNQTSGQSIGECFSRLLSWCDARPSEPFDQRNRVAFALTRVGSSCPPGRFDGWSLIWRHDELDAFFGKRLEELPPRRRAAERRAQVERRRDDEELQSERGRVSRSASRTRPRMACSMMPTKLAMMPTMTSRTVISE